TGLPQRRGVRHLPVPAHVLPSRGRTVPLVPGVVAAPRGGLPLPRAVARRGGAALGAGHRDGGVVPRPPRLPDGLQHGRHRTVPRVHLAPPPGPPSPPGRPRARGLVRGRVVGPAPPRRSAGRVPGPGAGRGPGGVNRTGGKAVPAPCRKRGPAVRAGFPPWQSRIS